MVTRGLSKLQLSRWLKYVNRLKKHLNINKKIKVVTCTMPRDTVTKLRFAGSCDFYKNTFIVCIGNHLPYQERIETLVHELAHCLDWTEDYSYLTEHEQHSESWGKHYASVYNACNDIANQISQESK